MRSGLAYLPAVRWRSSVIVDASHTGYQRLGTVRGREGEEWPVSGLRGSAAPDWQVRATGRRLAPWWPTQPPEAEDWRWHKSRVKAGPLVILTESVFKRCLRAVTRSPRERLRQLFLNSRKLLESASQSVTLDYSG